LGWKFLPPGWDYKQAKIIQQPSKHEVESIGSRDESMGSMREFAGFRVESVGSMRESIGFRIESIGWARHFGADYADLLGFFDKVKFDPWPEPPTGEVFKDNPDWSIGENCRPDDDGNWRLAVAERRDDNSPAFQCRDHSVNIPSPSGTSEFTT